MHEHIEIKTVNDAKKSITNITGSPTTIGIIKNGREEQNVKIGAIKNPFELIKNVLSSG